MVIHVVLDSNIYISALLWDGNERKIVYSCQEGKYQSFISIAILNEVERVLANKFKISKDIINEYLFEILSFTDLVFPTIELDVIKENPSDNRVLETAYEVKANYIISGDKHLLNVKKYDNIEIKRTSEIIS
ncbi:MAG: putative toxin-antitoxin system toxin component, PIN family [Methanosarcinales archaeon]|uniref:Putative toxin-antitoxin system toxin component, PIN family n=1 Tax=Candidatus Ethanoperedens thermophilum TaxID=2766897 RepID=A0A848D8W4_9EURY|nr:putative toxin-antitoxin system toxin component, PIN family [Candidatus Ethanoperedens thermophilum]